MYNSLDILTFYQDMGAKDTLESIKQMFFEHFLFNIYGLTQVKQKKTNISVSNLLLKLRICPSFLSTWWLQRELNQRHKDFQSSALPTEL